MFYQLWTKLKGLEKTNAGFYNYDEKGKRNGFWEELKNNFEILKVQPDINVVKDRLALIQCLEATRALESEVLLDIREGDVGAILGWDAYLGQEVLLAGWI